ncbi:hypothetical protein PLICRDRAFT_29179 [Plicaturopsis crispa FD-325 SS-3]|nr:hypothetical protein PLICRDRAFT_29179 [Plicaturopsis crispa FD-325 SS-3]
MVVAVGPTVYKREVVPRPRWLEVWEKHRHTSLHWVVELFAEALGVFFYTYAGVGSTAGYVVGNILGLEGVSSILQIGFAYAFGILLAIVVCAATSSGHFNPCVTISFVLYKGFPPLKGLRYIIAQIFGGYIACLLVYAQWKDQIVAAEAVLTAKGTLEAVQFTAEGTGGILALYVAPGTNLARVLLNEFVVDTFIGMTIWACLDSTNFFSPPAAAPWLISFAYAVAIWGFSPVGIAANTARDLGGRFAAMSIYGMKASGGTYAALTALTNIPAQLFGATLYEIFLSDSSRVLPAPHVDFMWGHAHHLKARGVTDKLNLPTFNDLDDKARVDQFERASESKSSQ